MKGTENRLFTSASIVVLLLTYSRQIVIPVDTCHGNEQSWENKSRSFPCNDRRGVYHCIQNSEYALIETCFQSYYIPFFKVGCPWVKIYKEKPILGNPFNPCPSEHSGCPGTVHQGYKTNELYRYPACIQSENVTIFYGTKTDTDRYTTSASSIESNDGFSQTILIVGGIFGCVVVFLFILVMVFCIRKREAPRKLSAVTESIPLKEKDFRNAFIKKSREKF